MIDIKVYIRGNKVPLSPVINVFDMDTVEFEIIGHDSDYMSSIEVKIFLEDYEIPCVSMKGGLTLKSEINHLFGNPPDK